MNGWMAGSDAIVKLFAIRKYSKWSQKQLYIVNNVQLPLNINVWIKVNRYFKNKGIVVKKRAEKQRRHIKKNNFAIGENKNNSSLAPAFTSSMPLQKQIKNDIESFRH